MSRTHLSLVVLLHALGLAALAQTRPVDSLPTMDELRALYDERQYQQVIRHVVTILDYKSTAATHDRRELMLLKAESHLRLGDANLAAKCFDEAADVAPDELSVACDRATALLVRRSRQNIYRPRSTSPGAELETLLIVEPEPRKLALRALFADERESLNRRLRSIERADSLRALVEGLDPLMHLRTLELAATGADDQTAPRLELLAARARDLVIPAIESIEDRVEKLEKSAHKKRKMGSVYRKRGLSDDEIARLRADAEACRHTIALADRFAAAVPASAEDFDEIDSEARQIGQRITALLSEDFTKLYDRD